MKSIEWKLTEEDAAFLSLCLDMAMIGLTSRLKLAREMGTENFFDEMLVRSSGLQKDLIETLRAHGVDVTPVKIGH